MKCFQIFKPKSRATSQSAPELSSKNKNSDTTARKRETQSSGSGSSSSTSNVVQQRTISEMYEQKAEKLKVFSFRELRNATNNFDRMLKIGEGGFGNVYKGTIVVGDQVERVPVAVKKLNKNGLQGHKQWVAEVKYLGVVEHPNLVKLIGYCAIDGERGIQRLLVYEFMPNRSLEDHLFNRALPVLPWQTRLQIVVGAACGLSYLHEELEVQVIYRDFKSSNVLLDLNFKPKLSDFGLAREGPTGDHTHVSTAVVGTFGYADPDYIETGHLTTKSDVWSFGVVLYEILTGRRSLERNLPKTQQKLLDWVKDFPHDSKKFAMIMDPRLSNQYSLQAARQVAKLAESCLRKDRNDRPKMSEVVDSLKQSLEASEIPELSKPYKMNSDNTSKQSRLPRKSTIEV